MITSTNETKENKMKTFTMTAASNPLNSDTWFDGFIDGGEFEAENAALAQNYLNNMCYKAGTSDDPNYLDNGPIIEEMDF